MRDFRDDYEMDDDGRLRKKKRVAKDRERISFTMQMMDAAAGFTRKFSDGTVDHTHWSRPGFRFADTDDTARIAANDAYEQRRARMSNAWRNKGDQQGNPPARAGQQRVTSSSLDQARALADTAYEERRQRMHYGNRHRQQDDAQADAASPRRTLADLQQSAVTAYEAKCERMRNAWRHD